MEVRTSSPPPHLPHKRVCHTLIICWPLAVRSELIWGFLRLPNSIKMTGLCWPLSRNLHTFQYCEEFQSLPGTQSRWLSIRIIAQVLPNLMRHILEEKAGLLYYLCPQGPGPMGVEGWGGELWESLMFSTSFWPNTSPEQEESIKISQKTSSWETKATEVPLESSVLTMKSQIIQ